MIKWKKSEQHQCLKELRVGKNGAKVVSRNVSGSPLSIWLQSGIVTKRQKRKKKNLLCQLFQFYILHSTFHVYCCIVYASSLEDFKSHSHRNLEFCPFPEELTPKSLLIFFLWLEKYDKLNRELIWRGFGWLPAGSKGLHTATASQVVLTTILIF